MTTYINIGNSCSNFTVPSIPLSITSNVYIINSTSGQPLNAKGSLTAAGFSVYSSSASNVFRYSDIHFKVVFNESLIRSGTNRQNWRLLEDASVADPTFSLNPTAAVNNKIIKPNPDSTAFTDGDTHNSLSPDAAGFPITAGDGTLTNLRLVGWSNTLMYNWITSGPLSMPASYGGVTTLTSTTPIYLQLSTNSSNYLLFDGTTYTLTTVNSVSGQIPTAFYFIIDESGTGSNRVIRYALSRTVDGTALDNLLLVSTASSGRAQFVAGSATATGISPGNQFILTAVLPTIGDTPAGFPDTLTTIFKHSVYNTYLYWDGTVPAQGSSALSNFSARDYWTSGLTNEQIVRGMQFKFIDQTSTANAASPGGASIQDWYHWRVVLDVGKATTTVNNTSNVALTNDGTFVIGAGTAGNAKGFGPTSGSATVHPRNTEGWAIVNLATDKQALVYFRAATGGGLPQAVGHLRANNAGTVSFSTTSPIPTATSADNDAHWQCMKCTTAAGQYCNPTTAISTSPSVNFKELGVFTLTDNNSLTWTLTQSGSELVSGDVFNIRLLYRTTGFVNHTGGFIVSGTGFASVTVASGSTTATITLTGSMPSTITVTPTSPVIASEYQVEVSAPTVNFINDSPTFTNTIIAGRKFSSGMITLTSSTSTQVSLTITGSDSRFTPSLPTNFANGDVVSISIIDASSGSVIPITSAGTVTGATGTTTLSSGIMSFTLTAATTTLNIANITTATRPAGTYYVRLRVTSSGTNQTALFVNDLDIFADGVFINPATQAGLHVLKSFGAVVATI